MSKPEVSTETRPAEAVAMVVNSLLAILHEPTAQLIACSPHQPRSNGSQGTSSPSFEQPYFRKSGRTHRLMVGQHVDVLVASMRCH